MSSPRTTRCRINAAQHDPTDHRAGAQGRARGRGGGPRVLSRIGSAPSSAREPHAARERSPPARPRGLPGPWRRAFSHTPSSTLRGGCWPGLGVSTASEGRSGPWRTGPWRFRVALPSLPSLERSADTHTHTHTNTHTQNNTDTDTKIHTYKHTQTPANARVPAGVCARVRARPYLLMVRSVTHII